MPASSRLRLIPAAQVAGSAGLLLPLRVRRIRAYAPARTARYCYTRVTSADGAGLEADLDVLDEHGTVLLAVRGLQLGIGASESANRDRVLNERLLTIDWTTANTARRGATSAREHGC